MEIKYGRKRKGIKAELDKFIESLVGSITDDEVKGLVRRDAIITGGSICSMLMGDPINDFDVYFRTKETTKKVAEYYVAKFKELNGTMKTEVAACDPIVKLDTITNIKGILEERVVIYIKSSGVAAEGQSEYTYFESQPAEATEEFVESLANDLSSTEKQKFRPVFLSQNAITLSDKAQIVIRFFGDPQQIHSNYDFVHAMCYYDYMNKNLVLPGLALECMLSRTLIYQGSLYPIASIFRMKKFIERGWRITAGQQLKIMWQISDINLLNKDVLKEQLTGVDQAYMHQLINALKDTATEKIDSAYVSAIIDKIFD